MAEQKQIQKKVGFALSSQTSKANLSFVILLVLMSQVRTCRLKYFCFKCKQHSESWPG